jgi:hypothetical protein
MPVLVSVAGLTPVLANGVAIALTGVLNFWIGDIVVFRGQAVRWSWRLRPAPRPRVR